MCSETLFDGLCAEGYSSVDDTRNEGKHSEIFYLDGLLIIMRSDDLQLAMQLDVTLTVDNPPAISEEVEKDENVEELIYAIDADDGNMSD